MRLGRPGSRSAAIRVARALPVVPVVLSAVLGACGSPAVTATPAVSPVAATATPVDSPPAAASAAAPVSPGTGPVDDPSLLAMLPPTVDGARVSEEPQSFAEAVTDPDFAANVAAAAFPLAASSGDLASGVVARLRPGVYSDAFFRDWRDTYNQGACAQAGGLVGNAEATLGGRTVYIATCAGGLLVYHAYLPRRDVVVSLFSVGDRRFGEQLMRDLRP